MKTIIIQILGYSFAILFALTFYRKIKNKRNYEK